MMVKVQDLKEGQTFRCSNGWETVSRVDEYESGVMVWLVSSSPFISSNFASYSLDTLVQVW
jgi:hypothetical protein